METHYAAVVEYYTGGRWRSCFQILSAIDADRARYLAETLPRIYRLRP